MAMIDLLHGNCHYYIYLYTLSGRTGGYPDDELIKLKKKKKNEAINYHSSHSFSLTRDKRMKIYMNHNSDVPFCRLCRRPGPVVQGRPFRTSPAESDTLLRPARAEQTRLDETGRPNLPLASSPLSYSNQPNGGG